MIEIFPRKFQQSLLNSQVQLTHLKGLSTDVEALWHHDFTMSDAHRQVLFKLFSGSEKVLSHYLELQRHFQI